MPPESSGAQLIEYVSPVTGEYTDRTADWPGALFHACWTFSANGQDVLGPAVNPLPQSVEPEVGTTTPEPEDADEPEDPEDEPDAELRAVALAALALAAATAPCTPDTQDIRLPAPLTLPDAPDATPLSGTMADCASVDRVCSCEEPCPVGFVSAEDTACR
jgi:hypothetical protein